MRILLLLMTTIAMLPISVFASSCNLINEEEYTTFITGQDGSLTCVTIPNLDNSTELKVTLINSGFYRPEISYRAGRDELINILPSPTDVISKTRITARQGTNFSLFIGKSPLKYSESLRIPHTVHFYLATQNGTSELLIVVDMMKLDESNTSSLKGASGLLGSSLLHETISSADDDRGNGQCDETNRTPVDMPATANVNHNIYVAKKLAASLAGEINGEIFRFSWFYFKVRNGAEWDYKQLDGDYEDFGNFNYGATGAALNIPRDILRRAAGWAQTRAGTTREEWGHYLGRSPYGDDPADRDWIDRGIKYYEDLLADKSVAEIEDISVQKSDLCRSRGDSNQTMGTRDDFRFETGGNGRYMLPIDDRLNLTCYSSGSLGCNSNTGRSIIEELGER